MAGIAHTTMNFLSPVYQVPIELLLHAKVGYNFLYHANEAMPLPDMQTLILCLSLAISVDGVSVPEEEREGHAWLQELEEPKDLEVVGAMYRGPEIVEK